MRVSHLCSNRDLRRVMTITTAAQPAPAPDEPDPQTLADCLKQLPRDSIEAETARDRRLMEQWGWSSSQPGR